MTVYSIERIFLHPTLTKIDQDGDQPNYTSIKQLRGEITSNIVAVSFRFRRRVKWTLISCGIRK